MGRGSVLGVVAGLLLLGGSACGGDGGGGEEGSGGSATSHGPGGSDPGGSDSSGSDSAGSNPGGSDSAGSSPGGADPGAAGGGAIPTPFPPELAIDDLDIGELNDDPTREGTGYVQSEPIPWSLPEGVEADSAQCELRSVPDSVLEATCSCDRSEQCRVSVNGAELDEATDFDFDVRLSLEIPDLRTDDPGSNLLWIDSNWASVVGRVIPTNDEPSTSSLRIEVPSDQLVVKDTLPFVDVDSSGTFAITEEPTLGSVTLDPDTGEFEYTKSEPHYYDCFRFSITDGEFWDNGQVCVVDPDRLTLEEALNTPGSWIQVGAFDDIQHTVQLADQTFIVGSFASSSSEFTTSNGFFVALLDGEDKVVWGRVFATQKASYGSWSYSSDASHPSITSATTNGVDEFLVTASSGTQFVDGDTLYKSGMRDGDYVMKFDLDGTLVFYDNFGSSSSSEAVSNLQYAQYDSAGNLYTCGVIYGTVQMLDHTSSTGYEDGVCRAYDADNNVQWVQQFYDVFEGSITTVVMDEDADTLTVNGSYVGSIKTVVTDQGVSPLIADCGDLYCTGSYSATISMTTGCLVE